MDDLKGLLDLFKLIEPLQKEVEGLGNGLDGPALNETRNATYHLLSALCGDDRAQRADQLHKAERHAQRAIYDCSEAMILNELEKLRLFKDDYRLIVIGETLPDYQAYMECADEAKYRIAEARKNKENREQFYKVVQEDIDKLRKVNSSCSTAREELNKRIMSQNRKNFWAKVALAGTGVGVLITLLAWMYPRPPV
ncbi:MAG: hypothetical protein QG662_701 [Pseudomonadota bacterium]|nr:hypothetical protein [Pseudomonadota bacterium]